MEVKLRTSSGQHCGPFETSALGICDSVRTWIEVRDAVRLFLQQKSAGCHAQVWDAESRDTRSEEVKLCHLKLSGDADP